MLMLGEVGIFVLMMTSRSSWKRCVCILMSLRLLLVFMVNFNNIFYQRTPKKFTTINHFSH